MGVAGARGIVMPPLAIYRGRMDLLLALFVTLALGTVVLAWLAMAWWRKRHRSHDDLARAGWPSRDPSPTEAYQRAQGEAAWTRISGGG